LSRPAAAKITQFDPPDSIGTTPTGINKMGVIAGYYRDGGAYHSFVRAPDGTITALGDVGGGSTFTTAINTKGAITGYYWDQFQDGHGFLRKPDGKVVTFDVSGALATLPVGINSGGAVAGGYFDSGHAGHGFVRDANGTITQFDVPVGSILDHVAGINDSNAVDGVYETTADGHYHGFVRTSDGSITAFDPPGSWFTIPTSMNNLGAIVGYWWDNQDNAHGFLRAPDGTITTIDEGSPTHLYGINDTGDITGVTGSAPCFVLTARGVIRTFSPKGANPTPVGINSHRVIAGFLTVAGKFHGFVRSR
jgi:hypothetical protein